MHTAKFDFTSYAERLAEQVIESDSSFPIINHDYTYGVNKHLRNKGFKNYAFVVYHGNPSPRPHYTLNVHKEEQIVSEMYDISEEQALALNMGLLNIWDLRFHLRQPERYSIPSDAELAEMILASDA